MKKITLLDVVELERPRLRLKLLDSLGLIVRPTGWRAWMSHRFHVRGRVPSRWYYETCHYCHITK